MHFSSNVCNHSEIATFEQGHKNLGLTSDISAEIAEQGFKVFTFFTTIPGKVPRMNRGFLVVRRIDRNDIINLFWYMHKKIRMKDCKVDIIMHGILFQVFYGDGVDIGGSDPCAIFCRVN